MLGDIDYHLKPQNISIFIAKPNREIISKIAEAYEINRKISLNELYSLSFKIPFGISENNAPIRNKNVDVLKERQHIKIIIGNKEEWYIVTKISDKADNQGDSKEVMCTYLPYELGDKLIGGYEEESKHARQVLNDILASSSIWSIDYIDADFELTYRSWEFSDTTLLDAVYQVAEKYNAILEWNTVDRTIRMVKPELHGMNRLGSFSMRKYLKSVDREYNAELVVTRLKPVGKDGLGIERLTSNGAPYIEDFSYWMFPFERDASRHVIQHSHFMSDSLCHALLDYQELQESYDDQFSTLLEEWDNLELELSKKNNELVNLKKNKADINEIQIAYQFDKKMFFNLSTFTGGTKMVSFPVDREYSYAVLVKVEDTTNKTLLINGINSPMKSNSWVVSKKIKSGIDNINVAISGTGTSEVFIQVTLINESEIHAIDNDLDIIEKYNFDYKNQQIQDKQLEIQNIQAQLSATKNDVRDLRNKLSVHSNFTRAQIEELDKYIFEQKYVDDTLIEEIDLLEEAKKRFAEYQIPQLEIKMDIVNFLECIEEQHNWNQLYLGDKIIVDYDAFNMKVEAKIIEINYDYEKSDISLVIANFKDLSTNQEILEKYIYDSKITKSILDDNKSKWNKAIVDNSEFSRIFEHFWDKVTNQINMAVNQTVDINDMGITITDNNDPLRFLRLTNGALGLTRSGGLRYETAITADGIIAEMVLGKLILGQRITIGDEDGIWLTEGPKTTITDRCGREAMKLGLYEENPDLFGMLINRFDHSDPCSPDITNRVIINSEDGFVIQQKQGSNYNNIAWLDTDGLLNVKKLQIDFADGILSNGITIDNIDGIFATRSDNKYRSWMSGTRGFVIQQNENTSEKPDWKDIFWADISGQVHVQQLKILNSRIELGTHPDMMVLDPYNGGFWAGDQNHTQAPAHIAMDGTAKFKKLIVTNGAGALMMDSENKLLDLNQWNVIGAGRIQGDSITVNTVIAGTGFISDLTVNKLNTFGKTDRVGDTIDYVHVQDNYFRLITGKITGRNQVTSNGKALYWTDDSKSAATDQVTDYPVWDLEIDENIKLMIDHKVSSSSSHPRIIWGQGDGKIVDPSINDGLKNIKSARGFIEKPQNSFDFTYFSSNYAKERSLSLDNNGTVITSEDGIIRMIAKDYELGVTTGGAFSIKHINGAEIELSSNGKVKIKSNSGIDFESSTFNFI